MNESGDVTIKMTQNNKHISVLRVLSRIGIAIVMIPVLLITLGLGYLNLGIGYEIYGYWANHTATDKQTKAL